MGAFGVKSIDLNGTFLAPPAEKDLLIEVVGDSITAGHGVLNNFNVNAPLYEDATRGWPYLTAKALDADLWLVRSYGYETTTSTLKALNPRYTAFEAWKRGNIYSCDTEKRNIFNDVAFHPDKVLAEYIAIFHPELMPGYELQYFKHTR